MQYKILKPEDAMTIEIYKLEDEFFALDSDHQGLNFYYRNNNSEWIVTQLEFIKKTENGYLGIDGGIFHYKISGLDFADSCEIWNKAGSHPSIYFCKSDADGTSRKFSAIATQCLKNATMESFNRYSPFNKLLCEFGAKIKEKHETIYKPLVEEADKLFRILVDATKSDDEKIAAKKAYLQAVAAVLPKQYERIFARAAMALAIGAIIAISSALLIRFNIATAGAVATMIAAVALGMVASGITYQSFLGQRRLKPCWRKLSRQTYLVSILFKIPYHVVYFTG